MVEPFSNPNFTSRKLHWDEDYDGSGHNHYEWVSTSHATCDYETFSFLKCTRFYGSCFMDSDRYHFN